METKILISGDYCPIGRVDKYLKKKYNELFNGFDEITKT